MNDDLRNEVLRRKYGGQSGRDIARDLHLSRKTVAKVLADNIQNYSTNAYRRVDLRPSGGRDRGLSGPHSVEMNGGFSSPIS